MIKAIWKVPAQKTRIFKKTMFDKKLRHDSYATLINNFAGFNFWYETDSSFGDITEQAAENLARRENLTIQDF